MEIDEINLHDRYAEAVKVNGAIVGHVPREVSKIVYYFIKNGGSVVGEVHNSCALQINSKFCAVTARGVIIIECGTIGSMERKNTGETLWTYPSTHRLPKLITSNRRLAL